jgi:Domain of Unknown Function (DUF748)
VFNFTDLLEFHQSSSDSSALATDSVAGELFQYDFSELELIGAHFSYTDASIDKALNMQELSFYTPHIAWNQEDRSDTGIKFSFHEEGYFQSKLYMDPNEGDFNAQIVVESLHLDAFNDFLRKSLPLDSIGGLVNTELFISGDLDEVEKSIVSGSVDLFDFKLTDQEQRKLIAFKEVNLTVDEIDMDAKRMRFNSLALRQPYLYVELYDSSNNFFEFFGIEPDSTAPLFFALNSFQSNRGSF